MGVDYYGVLQVPRGCNFFDINKSFRRAAIQYHPERLKEPDAERTFTLLCEAYDVLSNKLRRAVYDQFGEEGLKAGVPLIDSYFEPYCYHGNPYSTYRDFFGTDSPYADVIDHLKNMTYTDFGPRKFIKGKNPPIKHPLFLTLKEIFFGGVKKMKIHRLTFVDEQKDRTEVREKILSVPIKRGTRAGTEITFVGEGDQHALYEAADIIFVTHDKKHNVFTRDGNDLIVTTQLTLQESLVGKIMTIHTLDRRTFRLAINDVISNDYEKIVEDEGLPILENPEEKGNLKLRFSICFPTHLSQVSRRLLAKAFEIAGVTQECEDEKKSSNQLVLVDKMRRVEQSNELRK